MTALPTVTWRLDAYAGHWLTDADLHAVTAWMRENGLDGATTERPVVVADGLITYGQDRSGPTVRAPHRDIVMMTVQQRTAPPNIQQPECSPDQMAALQAVFATHEWSSGFDGVCVSCSSIRVDDTGRIWCRRDDAVAWPCPPVRQALVTAGCPLPLRADDSSGLLFGDCLDPADNARAFGGAA